MTNALRNCVSYARVSSKEQEREGFSIDAQKRLFPGYAEARRLKTVREFIDIETAKESGRKAFNEMVKFLREQGPACRVLLVEKTDRLYRNFRDYVTIDDLDIEVHFVKEGNVLARDSRSAVKFEHGIRVLMAKNFIDNLGEEARKGMQE